MTQDSHVQYTSNVRIGAEIRGEVCRHDYRLNEEIGIICRLCGFVSTEIKDVPPPFVSRSFRLISVSLILKHLLKSERLSP